jgi:hypothetical protein
VNSNNLCKNFQKDKSGKTTYERAIEKRGKEHTFKVIKQCISADTTLPILHHVIKQSLLEKYIEQTTNEFAEDARSRSREMDRDNDEE